jgi:hypothetical protein
MLTRLLVTALLAIIPAAAHAQGALLVVTKQSHALATVAVVDLHQLVKEGQIDAGREPDGLAWWAR